MRASLHFGLAALLALAPALCCCNVSWFGSRASAAVVPSVPCPSCPATPPAEKPVRHSCCHEEEPAPAAATPVHTTPAKHEAPGHAPARCKCCGERPVAALPDPTPAVAAPEPTGEFVPVAFLGLAAVAPEHLGLVRGLDPPERAGVDALHEALFARHVLRC